VLSLAWHTTDSHQLGVTLSNGEIVLIDCLNFSKSQSRIAPHAFGSDNNSPTCKILNVHDLEAWTLAFTVNGHGAFSGGDDGTLRHSPIRSSESADLVEDSTVPISAHSWIEKRIHNAGVTAILPLSEDIVVTGSYDDHIRVIHVPTHGRKMLLVEANLGGGVWRLKKIIQDPDIWEGQAEASFIILASCMHAGARIVKLKKWNDIWNIEVLARFEEHKSMNYGSDMQPQKNGYSGIVVSTSFYDKLLCVWRFAN
jgi:diphthamide biosynthesis protein 7